MSRCMFGPRSRRSAVPRWGTTARTLHTLAPCTTAVHGSAPAFASPRVRTNTCPSTRRTSITRCVTTGLPGTGAWNEMICPGRSAETDSLTSIATDPGGIAGLMLPVSIVTVW